MPQTSYTFRADGGQNVVRLFEEIGKAAEFAQRRILDASRRVPGALRAVDTAAREVDAGIAALSGRLGVVGNVLSAFGPSGRYVAAAVGGAAALGAGFLALTERAIQQAGALRDQADQTGFTAEKFQELVFAGRQVGISQEQVSGALTKFTTNVGKAREGTGTLVGALKGSDRALLEQVRTAASSGEAFDLYVRKIAAVKSPADQAALALEAFGKEGAKLVPLLRQGEGGLAAMAAEARRLGVVLDESLIDRADEIDDKLQNVSAALRTQLNAAFLEAAPIIAAATGKLAEFVAALNALRQHDSGPAPQIARDIEADVLAAGRHLRVLEAQLGKTRENLGRGAATPDQVASLETEIAATRKKIDVTIRARDAALDAVEAERKARAAARTEAAAGGAPKPLEPDAGAKKAATERKRLLEELAKQEREAALAPLDAIRRVERERDLALEEYRQRVASEKDAEVLFARFRTALEAETGAKIADLQAAAVREAHDEAEKIAERAARAREDAARREAEAFGAPFQHAAEAIQETLGDAFFRAFRGGEEAAFDFEDTVKDVLARLAAEAAQLVLFRGVLGPALQTLVGAPAAGSSTSGASAGLLGNLLGAVVGGGGGGGLLGSALSSVSSFSSGTSGGGGGGLLESLFVRPASGGGGGGGVNTFGAGSIAKRLLGDRIAGFLGLAPAAPSSAALAAPAFGGLIGSTVPLGVSSGTIGAGVGFGSVAGLGPTPALTAAFPSFTTLPVQAAGSGVLQSGLVLNSAGQVVQAGSTGASAGSSAVGSIASVVALVATLGLAAKGIADTRASLDKLTLGTAGAAGNRLTGLQGTIVAGATAGGAAIGSVVPLVGTVIGAGVGAAVGSAIANAIGAAVVKGTASGLRNGLDQRGLEKRVIAGLEKDLTLNILSGGINATAIGPARYLAPLVTPSIERIFGKSFRQVIGGPGGLDTRQVPVGTGRRGSIFDPSDGLIGRASLERTATGGGFFGLERLLPDAIRASRIIANLIGAGGTAFGENRGRRFSRILLGGVDARAQQTGLEPEQVLAEGFAGAFRGRVLPALGAALKGPRAERRPDVGFVVEQFAAAAPNFGFDYQRQAAAALADEGVPGGRARRRSRAAVGEALEAGLSGAGGADITAFRRSLTEAFRGSFLEGVTKALKNSSLGEAFSAFFTVDKDRRKDLRRARRRGDVEGQVDILSAEFQEDVDQFARTVADPAFARGLARINDELFRLTVATSTAAGDDEAVRGAIVERLRPQTERLEAIDQAARSVRERVAIGVAGPGVAGQEAQLRLLGQTRTEAERTLVQVNPLAARGVGLELPTTRGYNPNALADFALRAGGLRPDSLEDLQPYLESSLQFFEAQLALQRQIVETLEQAREVFRGLRSAAEGALGTFDSRADVADRVATARQDFNAAAYIAAGRAGSGQSALEPVSLGRAQASLTTAIGVTAQRQAFLEGTAEGFAGLRDQVGLALGGRRAARSQLAERRGELAERLAVVRAGGAGADRALVDVQRLLPQILQLGQGALSGGGFRALQREVQATAAELAETTEGAADVARQQLEELEELARLAEGGTGTALGTANDALATLVGDFQTFADTVGPVLTELRDAAKGAFVKEFQLVSALVGNTNRFLYAIAAKQGVDVVAIKQAEVPKLARGGMTLGEGLVHVHPRELILPLDNPRVRQELARRPAAEPAAAVGTTAAPELRRLGSRLEAQGQVLGDIRTAVRDPAPRRVLEAVRSAGRSGVREVVSQVGRLAAAVAVTTAAAVGGASPARAAAALPPAVTVRVESPAARAGTFAAAAVPSASARSPVVTVPRPAAAVGGGIVPASAAARLSVVVGQPTTPRPAETMLRPVLATPPAATRLLEAAARVASRSSARELVTQVSRMAAAVALTTAVAASPALAPVSASVGLRSATTTAPRPAAALGGGIVPAAAPARLSVVGVQPAASRAAETALRPALATPPATPGLVEVLREVARSARAAGTPRASAQSGGFTIGEGPVQLHPHELIVPLEHPRARRALEQLRPKEPAAAPVTVNVTMHLAFPAGTTKAQASEWGRSFGDGFEGQVMRVVQRVRLTDRRVG